MRFKPKYKSCIWARADIWGDLLCKEKTFLRPKWDLIMGMLGGRKRRRRPLAKRSKEKSSRRHTPYPLCHNYNFVQPHSRPNQTFKYNRWGYRNTLSILLCLRRFYGDLSHNTLKKICILLFKSEAPIQRLLGILEGRLDVTLYRLGFFHSIFYSRQAIQHNKVLVNGKYIKNNNFILQKGDFVEFCPTKRSSIRSRLLFRYKPFRSFRMRLERWRLTHRFKFELHLQPTPSWIQTDYSNLSFVLVSDIKTPIIYPFRANIDEALWFYKQGY
uniref:Ribosomal protein S4 n=2 Tax=Sargassum TaxID=3015 RepID=A0A8K1YNV0_9PHAE|nr:ribosomal protein S4 [Sargassum muticum]YP_010381303.1 ribosomal protein S4 [Sargassum kjellmanianum]UVW81835.1 ribosomal protein S4 [Sargassum siliquastrum]AIE46220.1 ribosomal protein S4 [Sargassum muticum]UDH59688.1 ribosomal protein S4 [Sargassum kjellmanianum]UQV81219.1 ribosomal protein S4 [Sargassum muticum]